MLPPRHESIGSSELGLRSSQAHCKGPSVLLGVLLGDYIFFFICFMTYPQKPSGQGQECHFILEALVGLLKAWAGQGLASFMLSDLFMD